MKQPKLQFLLLKFSLFYIEKKNQIVSNFNIIGKNHFKTSVFDFAPILI